MAVKEKNGYDSYDKLCNPINGHWAASNYDLCTTVLSWRMGAMKVLL